MPTVIPSVRILRKRRGHLFWAEAGDLYFLIGDFYHLYISYIVSYSIKLSIFLLDFNLWQHLHCVFGLLLRKSRVSVIVISDKISILGLLMRISWRIPFLEATPNAYQRAQAILV
jgi:hypothetical protein